MSPEDIRRYENAFIIIIVIFNIITITGYYRHCKFQQKPLYETLATRITNTSCETGCIGCNWLPTFRLFAVTKWKRSLRILSLIVYVT